MRYYADHAEEFLAPEPLADPSIGRSQYGRNPLRPDRHRARRDAVELPVVAGHPVRSSRPDGGQHRAAQARVERAAGGALPRHPLRARRLPGRCVPHSAHPGCRRRAGAARPAREGRDPDRLRAGGALARRDRRIRGEARRARTRRLRPVHRDAERRPRRGIHRRRHGPQPERRAVVHRGQAVHRAHRRLRRLRRAVHGQGRGTQGRRPARRGAPTSARSPPSRVATTSPNW